MKRLCFCHGCRPRFCELQCGAMELNKKGLSWTSSEKGETRSGKKRGDALGRNSFYLFSARLKEFLLCKTPLKTCMSAEGWSEAVCKEDGWKQRQESWGPMGSAGDARAASRSVGNTLGGGMGREVSPPDGLLHVSLCLQSF